MTVDDNKSMTIDYNHLNLPRRITRNDGSHIDLTYDATGREPKKEVVDVSGPMGLSSILYQDGIEYHGNNDVYVNHAEGRMAYYFPGTAPRRTAADMADGVHPA